MRRKPFVIGSSADPQKSPQRVRLLSGDFILDIVETGNSHHFADRPVTYMVHRRSTGEILTLGDAPNFEQAERIATWTITQITGVDPGFDFSSALDRTTVA